jgi:hypothetical protein
MYSTLAAAMALVLGTATVVASDPIVCSRGPSQASSAVTVDLEQSAPDWGGYCEGLSQWTMSDTLEGLRLEYQGGEPYSNVHFYRNLTLPPTARSFTLSFDIEVPVTTFANQGAPSTIQALEFTASRWADGVRHEWAIQWVNVGPDGPGYRYWNPATGWTDSGVSGTLSPGWHRIVLAGQVVTGGAKLKSFQVDGVTHRLNVTSPSLQVPGSADVGAVAIQLDGNWEGAAYGVTVRDIDLVAR